MPMLPGIAQALSLFLAGCPLADGPEANLVAPSTGNQAYPRNVRFVVFQRRGPELAQAAFRLELVVDGGGGGDVAFSRRLLFRGAADDSYWELVPTPMLSAQAEYRAIVNGQAAGPIHIESGVDETPPPTVAVGGTRSRTLGCDGGTREEIGVRAIVPPDAGDPWSDAQYVVLHFDGGRSKPLFGEFTASCSADPDPLEGPGATRFDGPTRLGLSVVDRSGNESGVSFFDVPLVCFGYGQPDGGPSAGEPDAGENSNGDGGRVDGGPGTPPGRIGCGCKQATPTDALGLLAAGFVLMVGTRSVRRHGVR